MGTHLFRQCHVAGLAHVLFDSKCTRYMAPVFPTSHPSPSYRSYEISAFSYDMLIMHELDREPCYSCAFHFEDQLGRIIYLNPTCDGRIQLLAADNNSAPNIQSSTFPGNAVIWNRPIAGWDRSSLGSVIDHQAHCRRWPSLVAIHTDLL